VPVRNEVALVIWDWFEGQKRRDKKIIRKHTCSAFTTSMMTPPFNMRAKPALTVKEEETLVPWPWPFPFVLEVGSSFDILGVSLIIGEVSAWRGSGIPIDNYV
jgi:hypothetical protein